MTIVSTQTHYRTEDGRSVPTFLSRPDGDGQRPAILMAYEFYGMLEVPGGGPHMRDVAERFARAGFDAAVPDYYAARGKQPTMSGGTISGGPSDDETQTDLRDGVGWLRAMESGNRTVGIVGWCGGGRHALLYAAQIGDVAAAVSFYGRLNNRPGATGPAALDLAASFRCPVFGAYGETDHAIPVASARQFDGALSAAGVAHEMHIYPGAGHAFMNDQRDSFVPAAAQDAWSKLIAFFDRTLR